MTRKDELKSNSILRAYKVNTGLPLKGTRQRSPLREAQACPGGNTRQICISSVKPQRRPIPHPGRASSQQCCTAFAATSFCGSEKTRSSLVKIGIGNHRANLPSPSWSKLQQPIPHAEAQLARTAASKKKEKNQSGRLARNPTPGWEDSNELSPDLVSVPQKLRSSTRSESITQNG